MADPHAQHRRPPGTHPYSAQQDLIAGFCIDADSGILSPIGLFEAEASPRSFALDPHGRFLICAGQDKNAVGVYAINPANGVLTPLHSYSVGLNPGWVETLVLSGTP